jgi:hypothetical protein
VYAQFEEQRWIQEIGRPYWAAGIQCKIKENEKREQGRGREQETEGKKKRTLRQVKDYISADFITASVTRVSNI